MKTIEIEITGTAPLLMHNPLSLFKQKSERQAIEKFDPKDEAEASAYKNKEGELIIPAETLYAAIIRTGASYKSGKRSMKGLLAGTIKFEPNEIPLGKKEFEIDLRRVVLQGKTSIIRARAKIPEWKANFKIIYDEKWITNPETLKTIFEDCGARVGIMDFRPSKGGWFGTFQITKWKETKQKA